MSKRDEAKNLLNHYFARCSTGWSNDNAAEIDALVDLIIDAACEEMLKRVREGWK